MAFVSSSPLSLRYFRRRPGAGPACSRPRATVRACSSSRNNLWTDVGRKESQLHSAVSEQRFGEAARLRDEIQTLRMTDDYYRIEIQLAAAVAEQRFGEAAVLRDSLEDMEPPPYQFFYRELEEAGIDFLEVPSVGTSSRSVGTRREDGGDGYPTSSVVETAGIVVKTDSWHMPELDGRASSALGEGPAKYTFKYKVRITNNTEDAVQLVGRHWIIHNSTGPESEVKGSGVVGRQPVLMPGESFEYTSACPLTCEVAKDSRVVGNMKGEYTLVTGPTGTTKIMAQVGKFYFVLPKDA